MNQIITTEAIVLRSIKYSETSKIVTFYTRELGRVGAIVKGVRKKESKLGSALEPMSHVQIVLYTKESREVQTVSQCELLKSFHHLAADLDSLSAGFTFLELVYTITHEQEQNIPLFSLLRDTLISLGNQQSAHTNFLLYFELKLAELLGYLPLFTHCGNCGNAIETETVTSPWFFSIQKGSPICGSCSQAMQGLVRVSSRSITALQTLHGISVPEEAGRVNIDVPAQDEIEQLLLKHLQTHVAGFRVPRSRAMFKGRG